MANVQPIRQLLWKAGLTLLLFIALPTFAADWQPVTDSAVTVDTGRGLYDRNTRTFVSTVTITNSGTETLTDDYRLVIDDRNKIPLDPDSFDDGCTDCYALPAVTGLAPGEATPHYLRFQRSRGRLVYSAHLEHRSTTPVIPTPPTVTFTDPSSLITVGASPLRVTGTVDDPQASLTINGAPITAVNGRFQADVNLDEGLNIIIARAVNQDGLESTDAITVSLDKTEPYVTIDYPTDGQTVTNNHITVSGLVNDIVRGTVTADDANVVVNGTPAEVANRSYLATNILLEPGDNSLTVQAADAVGNVGQTTITVTYEPQQGQAIELADGQGQTGRIYETLPAPLSIQLIEQDGHTPAADQSVVFRVVQGDGLLAYPELDTIPTERALVITTDQDGIAQVRYGLGSHAGVGNNRVRATAVGFSGEILFHANATTNPGDKVSIIDGNNQRGAVNQPLPQPLVVAVTDNGANLVAGARVRFDISEGGGTFFGGSTRIETTTDSDGRADAQVVLGPKAGLDVQRITATLIDSNPLKPITAGFSASALIPGPAGDTNISGVVLDNQDNPIPGVTLRIETPDGDQTHRQAVSDAQGQFRIENVPAGPVHLIADGSTAPGTITWPTLSYNLITVAGADNPMSAPIYLLPLDLENAQAVGAEDITYTLPEVPGFALSVKAGSVTFPDGSKTGDLSVTLVNANKIPMPPPNGMQPQFIVTIQPHGAKFDPPAPLTLPNVDGHAPGAQVEMYSYDHDLEEFVTIGLGTVSEDGAVIRSNNGVGVIKAGWHCGSVATGSGCCHHCPVCQSSGGAAAIEGGEREFCSSCQVDDTKTPDDCTKCENGSPKTITITDVEAKVEGEDEKWKMLPNDGGSVSFSFTGSAKSDLCNTLVYNWDFGDGQTGEGSSVSHQYNVYGEYAVTMTVQCGECDDQYADEVKTVVLILEHETVATIPGNRERLKLGIREEVDLWVTPNKTVRWHISGNGALATVNGPATTLLAGKIAGSEQITVSAEDGSELGTISFGVVEPGSLKFDKVGELLNGYFGYGRAGAGMELEITILPDDVSFKGLHIKEIPGPGTNVTGYFTNFPPAFLFHTPNPNWVVVAEDNRLDVTDTAAYMGASPHPPWEAGYYRWVIPIQYSSSVSSASGPALGSPVIQSFTMDGPPNAGRMTVLKGGHGATRSPWGEDDE